MTIPTDSLAPVAVESTDPWKVSGVGALVRGLKRVTAWITALSPAGATVHDTGPVPLTGSGNVTMVNAFYRRVGRLVEVRAEFHTVSAGALFAASLPSEIRPPTRLQVIALRYASTTSTSYASVAFNTDGTVLVSITGTAVTTTPGYTVRAFWFV